MYLFGLERDLPSMDFVPKLLTLDLCFSTIAPRIFLPWVRLTPGCTGSERGLACESHAAQDERSYGVQRLV